jgi:hypothetical protein
MPPNKFLDWLRAIPGIQAIPIVILTGAVHVPDEVIALVHKIFFKSPSLIENRLTALEILRVVDMDGPKAAD